MRSKNNNGWGGLDNLKGVYFAPSVLSLARKYLSKKIVTKDLNPRIESDKKVFWDKISEDIYAE